MEPKDKAKEIVKRFWMKNKSGQDSYPIAVGNAIIAVEEIIKANPYYFYPGRKVTRVSDNSMKEYWQSVLTELKSM